MLVLSTLLCPGEILNPSLVLTVKFAFLLTAYGAWEQVMFSQACVILLTRGCIQDADPRCTPCSGCTYPSGGCTTQWMHTPPPPTSTCTPLQWMQTPPPSKGTDGQEAVGTHPTGIHTCITKSFCPFFIVFNSLRIGTTSTRVISLTSVDGTCLAILVYDGKYYKLMKYRSCFGEKFQEIQIETDARSIVAVKIAGRSCLAVTYW